MNDGVALPSGAYWVVLGRLAGGPRPDASLEGVDVVIDLTESGTVDATPRRLVLPIPDFAAPTPQHMSEILDAIDSELSTGASVYVHCDAGVGRTSTVMGCWLARHGTTGEAAIEQIASLRAAAGLPPTRSPETDAQRTLVVDWRPSM